MTDEIEAVDNSPEPTEPEAEAVEETEVEAVEADTEESEESADSDEEQSEDSQFAEVEIDGKLYVVPAELKDGYLMRSDYTRKTMELAEQSKGVDATKAELETQSQQLEQFGKMQQVHAADIGVVVNAAETLKQFDQVDWQALYNEDPDQFHQLRMQRDNLKDSAGQAQQRIAQRNKQIAEAQRQQVITVRDTNLAKLKAVIPEWTPEYETKLTSHLAERGFSKAEFDSLNYHPGGMELIQDAMRYRELLKQRAKPKPKEVDPKPAVRLKAKSNPASKDPDKMSAEDWMAWRNTQLEKAG